MSKTFSFNRLVQAAFIGGCLFVSGCENDPKVIADLTDPKKLVEEGKQIEALFSQGGRMRSKLTSPYMVRSTSDTIYVEFPKSLHVNFFDSTGKVESQLNALYGKYYEGLNRVLLRDSVLVFNIQGDTLRCPELWWDQNQQKFYTDKKVRIRKNGSLINGEGLEAKQDLTDINIKRVTGLVPVPDSLR
jgi:LPS export ABC transporter protein LptC